MPYTSFLAYTKVELWDLTVCIAVNGKKFRSHTVSLTLVRQFPISNLSETNTHKHTHTDTHTDSDDYSLYIPEHKHYIIFELRHIGRYY